MAKERKKTDDEIRRTDSFKKYIENYSARTNYVKYVSFYEQSTKDAFRVVATLDCGSFQQRIIYYSTFFTETNFVDVEFSFENSEYSYMFYDIFNLFDIEDFNLYYYGNLMSVEDVDNAVKGIFEATENYLYYLEQAGSDEYLPNLIKNYETDMDTSYGDYDWREEEKDIDDLFFPSINHPLMTLAAGKITDKVIKKLKKLNEKGKLDTIYEKRLLKYIEAGNKVERKNIADDEAFEKKYWKIDRKIFIPIFALMFILILAGYFIAEKVVFKGALVADNSMSVFGVTIPYLREVGMAFISALILFFGFETAFGKKLIKALSPDELKEKMVSKFNQQEHGNERPKRLLLRIVEFAISVVAVVGFGFVSIGNVGFYNNEAKFFDNGFFGVYTVQYEDIELYKLDAVSVKNDEYEEAENAYAVSDGKGHYYEIGEIEQNGEIEKKLFEIAEKYNKEIVEIYSVQYLE